MKVSDNPSAVKVKGILWEYLPLIACIFILIIIVASQYFISKEMNDGKFVYTLDDAYIHMAYARNIVESNVWGITRHEYSSSTSSPLWTILLSGSYFVFGINDSFPFFLNIIFAVILLTVLYLFLKSFSCSNFFTGLILALCIIALPFSIHVFSGMEHILHTIFTLLFIYFASDVLSEDKYFKMKNAPSSEAWLIILAPLLSSVRYEGIFLTVVVSVLLMVKRKFIYSILLIAVSLVPVVIIGLKSIMNGSYFLPNSIMLKSKLGVLFTGGFLKSFADNMEGQLIVNQRIIVLTVVSVILLYLQLKLNRTIWSKIPLMLIMIISITLIQKFLNVSTLFRYDAYIIIVSVAVNAVAIYNYAFTKLSTKLNFRFFRTSKVAVSFLFLILIFLIWKGFYFRSTITATKNIYEQQYQMAAFINEYYSNMEIAANDIGAINYYSDVRCLDLIGIGSIEVTREKMNENFDANRMKEIAKQKNIQVAVIYDEWFEKTGLPPEWLKVGEWKISNNFICGSDRVSFYAVNPDEKEMLIKNLMNFAKTLPATVSQKGEYTFHLNSQ